MSEDKEELTVKQKREWKRRGENTLSFCRNARRISGLSEIDFTNALAIL